jgi:hypothetical protein
MKSVGTALLVSLVCATLPHGQDSEFEFTVSGALASKLEPDTRVLIWSPVIETKPNWARFSVKELPVKVRKRRGPEREGSAPFESLHFSSWRLCTLARAFSSCGRFDLGRSRGWPVPFEPRVLLLEANIA